MEHIVWSIQDDGYDWGRVGKLDLFWVETFSEKEDDWNNILHTTLPVDLGKDTLFETKAEAFARAEEDLGRFLKDIGAKVVDEETE